MPTIVLDAFELRRPLASGGMGVVWLGVHPGDGLEVAVKVVTSSAARDERVLRAFAREVRAVARLEHPGIVRVFDHGTVSDEAADRSLGELEVGSPYLAMELAAGTVADRAPRSWVGVRRVLFELLDGLAYAHARGVVHLDLKPENILVSDDGRLKLADFGIAHALGTEREDVAGGTPLYMAPEQFVGTWRDFGPWTDLYAVGCVAWGLVTGQAPLHGETLLDLAQAHMMEEPGEFQPRFAVPDGLEAWLRQLLEKSTMQRFACAADAARALLEAGSGAGLASSDRASAPVPQPAALTFVMDADVTSVWRHPVPSPAPARGTGAHRTARRMPRPEWLAVPVTWQRPAPSMPSPRLAGAGLGLYGLRELRLVGRTTERDHLWSVLRAVVDTGTQHAVVLRGAAGTGKSRLAAWLSERAHELGAAVVLRAVHGDPVGPHDGLAHMVEAFVRCRGLGRPEVAARVSAFAPDLPALDRGRLTELIRPRALKEDPGQLPVVTLIDAVDRRDVVTDLLGWLCRSRPVIVWLDDVQWGLESLDFARHLLEEVDELPVLVVLTVRDEAVVEGSDAERSLARILACEDTTEVVVGPLEGDDRSTLVESLLGLGQEVASAVEERTGGNPLFAVQLVGDWVQRGLLIPRDDGFALRPGADVTLPDALHEIWTSRVRELLAERPEADRLALERAAVLGTEVSQVEWDAICSEADTAPPEGLVDRMETVELARPIDGGWAFSHGMLVECLVRLARDAGRLDAHRLAACLALRAMAEKQFLEGRVAEAAERLERAAGLAHGDRGTWARTLGTLGMYHDSLGRVERAEEELEEALAVLHDLGDAQGEGLTLNRLGLLHKSQGRPQEAQPLLERSRELARQTGDWRLENAAVGNLATLHREAGRIQLALEYYEETLAIRRARGDRRAEGSALNNVAIVHLHQGRVDKARELYGKALEAGREVGNLKGQGTVLGNLGNLHLMQGRAEEARAFYEQALAIRRDVGTRSSEGRVLADMANLHRLQDDHEGARELYAQALEIHREVRDSTGIAYTLTALGSICLALGELDAARTQYEKAIAIHQEVGNPEFSTLECLADLLLVEGEPHEAAALCERALGDYRSRGLRRAEAIALARLGKVKRVLGDLGEAQVALEKSVAYLREFGDRRALGIALRSLGEVRLDTGDLDGAREALIEAAEESAFVGHRSGEVAARTALAELVFEG